MLATSTADKPLTFIVLFLAEALAWAGVPAIGAAAIGAAGALAKEGIIQPWALVVVGTLGAEAGGLCGWWLGRRVAHARVEGSGRTAVHRRQMLAKGEEVFERWDRMIVFFVPSWVSGALGMPLGRFAAWNLLAALLWTIGAGLGAYGLLEAASGGTFVRSILPILLAAAAAGGIVLLLRRRRGARGDQPADAVCELSAPRPAETAPSAARVRTPR